ncbi:MAG: NYN domain-containing protein, partial [Bryobacteraceae bacterium]
TKIAYADWTRASEYSRHLTQHAIRLVQRNLTPGGDKNGADINLALDALEMAFTHNNVNAFAIVSGDSDFIPLVNKLKEYGKTVFVVGGRAFTSTILQQNCHEFISYESLLSYSDRGESREPRADKPREQQRPDVRTGQPPPRQGQTGRGQRPAPLDLVQAMPLVERALQVLERRAVQPQLGLLKSTMLQLDSAFSEKAYGAGSFSDFIEKLKRADYVNVSGTGGRYIIERKTSAQPDRPAPKPEESLPLLRDVLETHRLDLEGGVTADELEAWVHEEHPTFDPKNLGFQEFTEFLNYAQDKLVVRVEPDEEKGLIVTLGAEFYPPALPEIAEPEFPSEEDEKQPIVEGQPSLLEPNPPPAKPKKMARAPRKAPLGPDGKPLRRSRKKKVD